MRKVLLIVFCVGFQSFCYSQAVLKSQSIPKAGDAKGTSLGATPKAPTVMESSPQTDTPIGEKVEKVVTVTKTAPLGVDINYLPFFGGYEKTEEQLINDEIFRTDCDKEFATRKEAGDFFNKMAWQYLSEGDKNTAIHRFNLSYLLNQDNYEIYWGLGAIEYQLGNFSKAIEFMSKGIGLSEYKNYVFMSDMATIYLKMAMNNPNSLIETGKAKALLNKAIEIQPQYTPAFVQLTIAELLDNNLDAAWENFHKAYNLNPAELSPKYWRNY